MILIVGDGGLMMNVQELATLAHHRRNIKVFVLNNGGYLTMRHSQDQGFEGRYVGSGKESMTLPHWGLLSEAFGISYYMRPRNSEDAQRRIEQFLEGTQPAFIEVMMDPKQEQMPKSVNRRSSDGSIQQTPIEDAWPYLERDVLEKELAA